MNFIRTTDENGNPLQEEPAAAGQIQEEAEKTIGLTSSEENGIVKTGKPEPMTEEQAYAVNEFMRRAEEDGLNSIKTLIGMRDVMERQKVPEHIREKILKGFVKNAYLDPRQEFSGKQAVAALIILLGTDRKEATGIVKLWWANPEE